MNAPPRYAELMHMTGLAPFTRRLAGELSGGMKQKLGLACTLVRPPRLLLLDEPTVGVDPVSRRELWSIVYRLVEEQGLTVLLSTAYLDEAERCQEVILIHEGRLLGQGSPASFSAAVSGRSFQITATQTGRRALQEQLTHAPGVVDAIIQGEGVRVVMKQARLPEARELLPGVAEVRITPVAPRFEDSFVDLLKKDTQPAARRAGEAKATAVTAGDHEVIVVRNVKRRFGDFYAVKDISFSVREGEVFGLLGANGAGKSTTFRMLCGLLPASEGTLRVAGEDLRRAAAKARAASATWPSGFPFTPTCRCGRTCAFSAAPTACRGPRSAPGSPGRWRNSNWALLPRPTAALCHWATNSAWRWRPPSCTTRKSCFWMNRPPAWTRWRGVSSGAASTRWRKTGSRCW